jgi:hypothetical protein
MNQSMVLKLKPIFLGIALSLQIARKASKPLLKKENRILQGTNPFISSNLIGPTEPIL